MTDLRPNLSLVNKLASAKLGAPALSEASVVVAKADPAVLQSVVNHSVDISALKGDLDKVRADLASQKAKLAELEQGIISLDGNLATLQKDNIQELSTRVQGVVSNHSALVERVAKVESVHSRLSGAFGSDK